VATLLGWILEWMIKLLNWIVFKVEEMPFSLITNIELTTFQCWLLMIILGAIILLVEVKSIRWLYVAFVLTLGFSFTQWSHYHSDIKQTQLVVYRVNGHSAMDIIHDGKAVFIADSALLEDQERTRFHITPNRLQRGVIEVNTNLKSFRKKGVQYFHVFEKTIAKVDSTHCELPISGSVDYLIVSQNAKPPKLSRSNFSIDQLIFDSSNSRWCVQQWKKWAGELPAHDVSVLHAFVVNL
jgi:competence protein ComEC